MQRKTVEHKTDDCRFKFSQFWLLKLTVPSRRERELAPTGETERRSPEEEKTENKQLKSGLVYGYKTSSKNKRTKQTGQSFTGRWLIKPKRKLAARSDTRKQKGEKKKTHLS